MLKLICIATLVSGIATAATAETTLTIAGSNRIEPHVRDWNERVNSTGSFAGTIRVNVAPWQDRLAICRGDGRIDAAIAWESYFQDREETCRDWGTEKLVSISLGYAAPMILISGTRDGNRVLDLETRIPISEQNLTPSDIFRALVIGSVIEDFLQVNEENAWGEETSGLSRNGALIIHDGSGHLESLMAIGCEETGVRQGMRETGMSSSDAYRSCTTIHEGHHIIIGSIDHPALIAQEGAIGVFDVAALERFQHSHNDFLSVMMLGDLYPTQQALQSGAYPGAWQQTLFIRSDALNENNTNVDAMRALIRAVSNSASTTDGVLNSLGYMADPRWESYDLNEFLNTASPEPCPEGAECPDPVSEILLSR